MSNYHLSVKTISRNKGRNIVNKAAYNSRSKLVDLNTGKSYNYCSRGETIHSSIQILDDSLPWLKTKSQDRGAFWSHVEKGETRKDAQLAREIVLSIPHEFTKEQSIDVSLGFVRRCFVSKGMVADVSIHRAPPDGDQRNTHAHVLLTMRDVNKEGFGKKNRAWNDRSLITEWRKEWAHDVNICLERLSFEHRIDHRSLKDQGISREPIKYKGIARFEKERTQAMKKDLQDQEKIKDVQEVQEFERTRDRSSDDMGRSR